jgi:DNA-directed RNA polymerase specialized sigma24 family protein
MTNSQINPGLAASTGTRRPTSATPISITNSVAEPSDATLLVAAEGDPDAFRDLYDRYAARVHGYFVRRTNSEDAALELTAETFSQAWIVRARFRDEADGSAAPWLFGIARNVLLMSVRRGSLETRATVRLGVMERVDWAGGGSTPEPVADWANGADELLETLPPSQRDAVRLRVLGDLGYDEVAAALGTSRSAARVRVHRGLSALRERLSLSKEDS